MARGHRILAAGLVLSIATIAGTAEAQVKAPGFYASGFGQYVLPSNPEYRVGVVAPSQTAKGDGFSGGIIVGYAFEGGWDIGGGGQLMSLTAGTPVTVFNGRDEAFYIAGDLNVGYTLALDSVAIRAGLGARYAMFKHIYVENVAGMTERFNGAGPRATLDGAFRFSDSWLVVAGIGGGPLFGHTTSQTSAVFPAPNGPRTVWNLDGLLGVGYDLGVVNVVLGWRAAVWWNLHSSQFGLAAGGETRFTHGPFVRVSYNWGAPGAAMAPPPPPMEPKPAPAYMVFFDFDRAVIMPTAAETIRKAAADAKAGKKTRIGVTGHTDRSGSDAYNMALSLRRANAVKDQLVREGIPATEITVVGRGETQPLVQTADGVREPQNRRVEIVLQ